MHQCVFCSVFLVQVAFSAELRCSGSQMALEAPNICKERNSFCFMGLAAGIEARLCCAQGWWQNFHLLCSQKCCKGCHCGRISLHRGLVPVLSILCMTVCPSSFLQSTKANSPCRCLVRCNVAPQGPGQLTRGEPRQPSRKFTARMLFSTS